MVEINYRVIIKSYYYHSLRGPKTVTYVNDKKMVVKNYFKRNHYKEQKNCCWIEKYYLCILIS